MTKNKNYRKFIDEGEILIINELHLRQALKQVKGLRGKFTPEARALLLALYYTGARPNELLRLKSESIKKEGTYVTVHIPPSKSGLARTVYLQYKKPLVQELYNYAMNLPPSFFMFHHYKGGYNRKRMTKKGVSETIEYSDRLRYHVKKWFDGVIPNSINTYYLRHNRFSQLALAGASVQEIRMLKGSKTDNSVIPYLHLSSRTAKKLAKKIV